MIRFHASSFFDLTRTKAERAFADAEYAWQVLPLLGSLITEIGRSLPDDFERTAETVWIARSAKVDASARIEGPAVIGRETEVRHCAFIRANTLIGDCAVVGNSSEIENSILFDAAQAPHFNYVGDSVLGYRVRLGAGVVIANEKIDRSSIIVAGGGLTKDTGLSRFGALLGDRAEIGCNSVLNPGTLVGRDSAVYPLSSVRGIISSFSIHKRDGQVVPRKVTT